MFNSLSGVRMNFTDDSTVYRGMVSSLKKMKEEFF